MQWRTDPKSETKSFTLPGGKDSNLKMDFLNIWRTGVHEWILYRLYPNRVMVHNSHNKMQIAHLPFGQTKLKFPRRRILADRTDDPKNHEKLLTHHPLMFLVNFIQLHHHHRHRPRADYRWPVLIIITCHHVFLPLSTVIVVSIALLANNSIIHHTEKTATRSCYFSATTTTSSTFPLLR